VEVVVERTPEPRKAGEPVAIDVNNPVVVNKMMKKMLLYNGEEHNDTATFAVKHTSGDIMTISINRDNDDGRIAWQWTKVLAKIQTDLVVRRQRLFDHGDDTYMVMAMSSPFTDPNYLYTQVLIERFGTFGWVLLTLNMSLRLNRITKSFFFKTCFIKNISSLCIKKIRALLLLASCSASSASS
jgi:hypothetical protein